MEVEESETHDKGDVTLDVPGVTKREGRAEGSRTRKSSVAISFDACMIPIPWI